VTTDDAGAASPAPDDAQSWEPSADDVAFALSDGDDRHSAPATRDAAVAPALPIAIRALDAPPPEPIGWAVEGLILSGEIALFAGEGASFKSTVALHIAAAAAGGYAVFGRFRTEARPALYVSEEDDAGILAHRLEAIVTGHAWDRDRSLGNVHILARAGASFTDPAWQDHLLNEVCRIGAGLVFLDPWCDLLGGLDENSNSEVRPVIKYLRSLASLGATPTVVHHVGKAAEGKRSADRIRGASALLHGSRSIYYFEDRGDAIGIECLKLSRAPKLPPFTITRRIESDRGNRAMWQSAKFTAVSPKERATQFVLDELRDGSANTTDLKKAAVGKGVSGEDIGRALVVLHESGEIAFEPAPRNEKRWYRVEQLDLASANGKLAKTTLPTLPDPALGKHASPSFHTDAHLAPPKGGQAQWDRGNAFAGQSGNLAPVDER
jgi:hypothetical protein